MAGDFTICVGTVGTGAWISPDGGESWRQVRTGLWAESRIFGFAVHPTEHRTLLAGADDGIYRSEDGGEHFERVDSPMNAFHGWKIAFDPADPRIIFAGTRPAALFRSSDGGQHWEKLRVELADECPNVRVPRVTALTVDPSDHRMVWAGVEVDGVRRSRDGGESWTRIAGGLDDPDIHDTAVANNGIKTVLTSTPREIFASTDGGESWQGLGVGKHFRLPYCRSLALKADDPKVLFVATGDGAIGSTGAIQRQRAELAGTAVAGRAEFADLGICYPSGATRPRPRLQPLRRVVRESRRRRFLGQAAPGVRRDPGADLDTKLAPAAFGAFHGAGDRAMVSGQLQPRPVA